MSTPSSGPADSPDAASPEVARELELEVTGVAHGGVFVARHEGRVVFVPDTLPGERVRARVSDARHESFWRAETLEVLEASPDRRAHVWSAASVDRAPEERAGGAEFGHIDIGRQRRLKHEVVVDSLRRFGRVEDAETLLDSVEAVPGAADGTGWRTRVRLHVDDAGVVGPYSSRSHTVIPVADLPLATAEVAAAVDLGRRLPGETAIDVVGTSTGDVRVLGENGGGDRSEVIEQVGRRRFSLEAGGFWQVHTAAAATLHAAVGDAVDADLFDPGAPNLDLYGGVGLLAAGVGDRFGEDVRITSVEASESATRHARSNLADWSRARAVTARVDRYLRGLGREGGRGTRSRSTIVLDPPRSGAGRQVMDALGALAPSQLVYVACDPVALARDVGYARKHGYVVASLRAFDLFPNTHHVEAVARLVRA